MPNNLDKKFVIRWYSLALSVFSASGLTKNPNLFVKKCFYFGHLVYLNSLIKNIFCLDLGVFRKSCALEKTRLVAQIVAVVCHCEINEDGIDRVFRNIY
ncbi:hypothetical protein ELY16_16165 [Legionella qingyii]|nr:hypothetical protein ELY16_16165 [Legionella qingyii]